MVIRIDKRVWLGIGLPGSASWGLGWPGVLGAGTRAEQAAAQAPSASGGVRDGERRAGEAGAGGELARRSVAGGDPNGTLALITNPAGPRSSGST